YRTIQNNPARARKKARSRTPWLKRRNSRASSGEKRDTAAPASGKSSHHLPAAPTNAAQLGQEMFCSQRAFMEEVILAMREVVLCAPVRTAIGTYNGSL